MLGDSELKKLGLGRVIPTKAKKDASTSLLTKENRDLGNWEMDIELLTERDKRYMVVSMLRIAIIIMSKTTCYSFGGILYLQRSGAGIGLRGSASLAKVCMGLWDKAWSEVMFRWGIKCKIYMRYIDDLRLYAYPIKPGWSWSPSGWTHDPDKIVKNCDIRETCAEFCKTFNSIMDFLEFTTENECDFETGFLPTLDMQTRVSDNGSIEYRFFSKPTNNNLVVENGTALPRNIIFGSLRQEVVRRLLNTSIEADDSVKVRLIEDMIQLMVNSKHKFAFIKSVVLQGITKFNYMAHRASLKEEHPEFMPLHRAYNYRRNERLLTKYVDKMTWFRREKLSDPYKSLWRSRIKFKWSKRVANERKIRLRKQRAVDGRKNQAVLECQSVSEVKQSVNRVEQDEQFVNSQSMSKQTVDKVEQDKQFTDRAEKDLMQPEHDFTGSARVTKKVRKIGETNEISSTMFVPTSRRSLLFKLINEKERKLSKRFDWSIKILEQARYFKVFS